METAAGRVSSRHDGALLIDAVLSKLETALFDAEACFFEMPGEAIRRVDRPHPHDFETVIGTVWR